MVHDGNKPHHVGSGDSKIPLANGGEALIYGLGKDEATGTLQQ
jgi:hypothetical protein